MREYLKKLRLGKKYTQREVANALNISQNYYSCIESGQKQKNIDLWLMIDIANFYKMDVNELIDAEMKLRNQGGNHEENHASHDGRGTGSAGADN